MTNKNTQRPILFADAPDGLRLPVIDVTHPAFSVDIPDAELARLHRTFLDQQRPLARLPLFLRRAFHRFFLRDSLLARALTRAEGSFLDSMSTYMLKLGPDNLPAPYDGAIDRRIAGAPTGIAIRLRLQQMATLLADAIAPLLAADARRPLHFVNIAGGPAMDSLNALILLVQRQRGDLAGRRIVLHTLDPGNEGVAFGKAARNVLLAEGAPLAGLVIVAETVAYDWRDTAPLNALLGAIAGEGPIVACSSEGGLFEYGKDQEIVDNLTVLSEQMPADGVVIGSVTRDDESMRMLKTFSRLATLPRGVEVFGKLAEKGGFRIDRVLGTPMSDQVLMKPIKSA